ncbi:MAG: response regulator [Verrucomicrobia bacterium]|nr:response regulator [Verrucomicrobiota bacterium]
MLDQDDLKWIAKTSTELNTTLQQIARYAEMAQRNRGDQDYVQMLADRVQVASKSAQALFDRVSSTLGETAEPKTPGASLSKPPENAAPEIPADIPVKNPHGAREYILMIDDEPEIAELAAEMLAEEGYKVMIAKDGFEALKIFQRVNRQIALVILDYFLPVMDGDAVFEELKALNPNVNVVLSSGFAEQNKIGAMLAQGLRGFIPKPYTRAKLLEQVRSTIDASRRPIR